MHRYTRFSALLLLSGLLAATAGCGLLPKRDNTPVNQYQIAPNGVLGERSDPTCGLVLRVQNFAVTAPWTGNDMLYTQTEHGIKAYAYNVWAAAPATMLGDALVQALGASGLYRGVLGPPNPGNPDLTLAVTLNRGPLQVFPAQAGGQNGTASGSQEVLVMTVMLSETASGKLIASRSFSGSQSAAPNPYGGVMAANTLAGRQIGKILDWLGATNGTIAACAANTN